MTAATAVPQALATADGWQHDVAQRNRTVAILAKRLRQVGDLHAPTERPEGRQFCTECIEVWPCPTWLLAHGQAAP